MKTEQKRILLGATWLLSFFIFIFLTKSLFWQDFFKIHFFVVWVLSFFILLALFSFLSLSKPPFNFFLLFLLFVFLILLFFLKSDFLVIISALLCLLFILFSFLSFKRVQSLLLKFNFFEVLKRSTPSFISSIALICAILFFLSPRAFGGQLIFPKKLFDFLFPLFAKPVSNLLFGADLSKMTVDEFLEKKIEIFSKDFIFVLSFKEKILEEEREKLGKIFETKLEGNEPLKEVIYSFLNKKISQLTSGFKNLGKLSILFSLFIVFRIFIHLLFYLLLPFLYFSFIILRKVSFFRLEKTQKEIEILSL